MSRRKRLGSALRQLRESAGLTGDQVIERAGWASASKLSRLENARSRPDERDILRLLDVYDASEETRAELTTITREAGDIRSWLRRFPAMTESQRVYAELESGCAEIREYSPVIVPGLLQTELYAMTRITSMRPLTSISDKPEKNETETPENEVRARKSRQDLLRQSFEPPHYYAVLEEAALGRRAGPPEVIRGQLAKLREDAELPNVTIQVLLRDAIIAEWYLAHTAFSLYRLADPLDPQTLAIEGISTNQVLTDHEELHRYSVVFDWLRAAALTPEETRDWLAEKAKELSTRSSRSTLPLGQRTKPPTQRSRRSGESLAEQ
ncbi:helix-turn-helix domain-containing protein [Micromonospora polyrhachis]|uniref:Transcriptional regulator with XRE-family HTH domain n=1 Tax=Micromonospora polyrhachis TaxID=1282883 RepID=A0A7W7SUS6_9ACTN|nr:helix-turn-helix transcriptional regulator [Micromonospora polyrhachis]MBB4960090.1 transcriptional regulator with XRE-family HTH domain [Micromonospora polyrhachis]